jgi:hypothetical protein
MPSPNVEMDDISDLATDLDNKKDEQDTGEEPYVGDNQLEAGDRLFATTIPCEAEFIQAMSNVSQ